jgi:hypothetical protein
VVTSLYTISTVHPTKRGSVWKHFFAAVLCCTGFVVLKLLDHHLAAVHDVFKIASGHFWSKWCDIGQILFVMLFFEELSIALEKPKKL